MSYCFECGAEVAEIDAFCPHCGISLKPPPFAAEEDAQDKTIAVSQAEMSEIVGNSISSPEEDSFSPDGEKNELSDAAAQRETGDLEKTGEAKFNENNASVVSPETETEIEDAGEIKPDAEAEFSQNKETSEEIVQPAQSLADNFSDIPTPAILQNEAPLTESPSFNAPDEKTEIFRSPIETESASFSQDERSVAARAVNAEHNEAESGFGQIDEENQASDLAKNERENSGISLQNDGEVSSPESNLNEAADARSAFSVQNNDAKIFDDSENQQNAVENEPAIEMPAEPVETVESHDSRFDSVKILEEHKNYNFNSKEQPAREKAFTGERSEPIAQQEKKEEISYTTPNIGAGTGGKKAKLKPLEEGTVLNGRYEIVRKIGGGGMGAVYLATDKNLGGILRAVKEMVQSYIEEEQQDKAVSDFKRESMLLTSLDHPSIPTIYDYFFDEKEARFYLVMKYISGGDLAARLRAAPEGRIDEVSVTDWAIQVADVLDYLHNRQPPIVYRDLKPANVMIDGNSGRVMLIDFGIARWINKEEKGVTAVGTMGYAPPELFSGNVEPRSDIYSLGSTMFHLLTGADPQSNPLLIFDFQKHPRPRQINSALSDQMERILMKSVEYNAENRFRTAAEMRDALKEHLSNLKFGKVSFGITKTPQAVSLSEQSVFCGFCGQKIVASDMFCAFCGSKQPLAQQGVQAAGFVPQIMTAQLYVESTNELDQPTFVLEKDENLVGRRDPVSNIFPEIDLSKFDPQTKISRRHARIWREGAHFLVEDMGSSNGTMVMPVVGDAFRLVPHQPHPLTNGEKLKMGDTTLHFVVR